MKRKRRKSRRAKRGIHISTKTGQVCKYRSGWEKTYLEHLDVNTSVKTYKYEPFPIPYISNIRTKKVRNYIPDVLVELIDGTKELIEIKPSSKINKKTVIKKTEAAIIFCAKHGIKFSFVTEHELRALTSTNKGL